MFFKLLKYGLKCKKTLRNLQNPKKSSNFAPLLDRKPLEKEFGEMVEWSITAVLKTAVLRGTGGSNPSLSANKKRRQHQVLVECCLLFLCYLLVSCDIQAVRMANASMSK